MATRVITDRYTRGGFQNPFTEGVFIYDNILYKCDDHQQTLLYFFLYGLTEGRFTSLFQIHSPKDGGWVVLKKKIIQNLLPFMDKKGGFKETNEYTTAMNRLYKYAKANGLIQTRGAWLSVYILENYPNIIKELHKAYPKIRVFL